MHATSTSTCRSAPRAAATAISSPPSDAAPRHLVHGDPVRVFNALGEVHCPVALNPDIKPGTVYPPTLVTTGDHDDRVVPAHSFKLAAEMQHTLANNANPILLRVDLQAGHGEGKSTQKRMEEAAEKYAIVAHVLGLPLTP